MVGRKTHRTRKIKGRKSRSKSKSRSNRSKRSKSKRSSSKSKRSSKRSSSKSKRSKNKRSSKRIIQSGGNHGAAYPDQAYGPVMAGNGLNQIGPAYNVESPASSNHYSYNMGVKALPADSNAPMGHGAKQSGGRRKSKAKKHHGGGFGSFITGLLPEELVNIGRSIPASVGHFADKYNGLNSTPSSMVYPTQQLLVKPMDASNMFNPVDIHSVYRNANAAVLAI